MPKVKKTISVVTSTRADYGLLFWLMKEIDKSQFLDLHLIVTGTHLSSDFGNTYQFIENDGFKINYKIDILSSGNNIEATGESAATALSKFTAYFAETKPYAVIVLGDRYEILAVAQAASIAIIPVIHLHGGEISEGANDDMFRHAITKLSCLHFTSCRQYRKRVIQMGEKPSTVKVVGALGIENIKKLKLLSRKDLENKFNIKFNKYIFLITFHPATMEKKSPENQFQNVLSAISTFNDTTFVISKANADAGGIKINKMIDGFCQLNQNTLCSHSFGQINYLSLMKIADVIIGNSSSGIIESPSLLTPTVNIGTRQKGRLCAESVLHSTTDKKDIIRKISEALKLKNKKMFYNPYDQGNSSLKIVKVLESINIESLLPKKFYDLK